MNCHCCNGKAQKFGFFRNRNRFVQRYRCPRCAQTFCVEQPLDGVRIEQEKAFQVIGLLIECMGIRAIQRFTGLHQETILNILASAGEHCARLLDERVRWTPSFRPLSAENKMDSPSLLSSLFLFVCRSRCALNPFGKERTSRAGHRPSSLSLLMGFQYLPPQAV